MGLSAQNHSEKSEFQTALYAWIYGAISREWLSLEKVLKGPHSSPQHTGTAREFRVAIFKETFVSKQKALCQLF